MKIVIAIIVFVIYFVILHLFSYSTAQTLVPGLHGMSVIPGVKFTWVIISADQEISLNLRYSGNGTTPPVSIVATAFTKPDAGVSALNQSSPPMTIAGSQVLNAGWISPNSMTIKFEGNSSLYDADLVTVIASPYTSITQTGCDPSYPDFCIPPPPPPLNCEQQRNDFTVLPPDPHGFDRDKDGVGCERDEAATP